MHINGSMCRAVVPLVLLIIISCSDDQHNASAGKDGEKNSPGLHVQVTGEWLRTDGNYILNLNRFNADSTINAVYLNPRSIHIAETRWKVRDTFVYILVKFEDEGYPGSYYSLGYIPEKDILYGLYYQAALDQEFEVVFERRF